MEILKFKQVTKQILKREFSLYTKPVTENAKYYFTSDL